MPSSLDAALGRACARWTDAVCRRARLVAVLYLAVSAGLLALALPHLEVDSNEDLLFSEELPFVPRRSHWNELFPAFRDPILVVVDASTPDRAYEATLSLVARLEAEPALFPRVDHAGGGSFFERNGLLYLPREELEELADRLVAAQPFLAELARDPSLRGLLPLLGDALDSARHEELRQVDLADALTRVADVTRTLAAGQDASLAWSSWIRGNEDFAGGLRQFLLVQPAYDFAQVNPGGATIAGLRAVFDELGLDGAGEARARMTGNYVLAEEESRHVTAQSTWAGLASFVLVGLVLGFGLRSLRVVLYALASLLCGLALTASFATATLGRLNLISVAFAVLFIGLSIDFAIHLCVRYLELLKRGMARKAAIVGAAGDVGGSLVICATTTAIGFFSFAPTDYRGVAELGIIAGSGMFVSLATNLTLLPALLALGPQPDPGPLRPPRLAARLAAPLRHRGVVLSVAGLLLGLALLTLPGVSFDLNPLRIRNAGSPSVALFDELLERGEAMVWNLSATAPDPVAAARLAERLAALETVDETLTLTDFVPEDQPAKLALVEDLAFLLGPGLQATPRAAPGAKERAESVAALRRRIEALAPGALPPEVAPAAAALRDALAAFESRLQAKPEEAGGQLEALDRSLTGTLPQQLALLRSALRAEPVQLDGLPPELLESWVATDGSVRIEVFPAEDLDDNQALEEYVDQVLSVAPEAYGEGFTIYRSGAAVERSLLEALSLAALSILAVLMLLWRQALSAALVMLPIGLAALLTAASTVWLGLPLNFANVIVIPLLLGMGVDTGIHLVHRIRSSALPQEGLLGTSTTRAVLLSALTTVASFGTLGLSTHPGLASLGRLLALGLGLILVCSLGLLPALASGGERRDP